ncbi:MAG: HDIG domain-containing protein [bacterium]|nr:HDIG domain-containing protein [bacterium]
MHRYSHRQSGQRFVSGDGKEVLSAGGLTRWTIIFNILIGLAILTAALLLYPPATYISHFEYQLGDVTQRGEEVIAPISFRVPINEKQLDEQRAVASLDVHPVYRLDPSIDAQMDRRLDKLYRDLTTIQELDSVVTMQQRVDQLMGLNPAIKGDDAAILLREGSALLDVVSAVVDSILAGGILDTRRPLLRGINGQSRLTLIRPEGETLVDAGRMEDQEALDRILERQTRNLRSWDPDSRQTIRSLARTHLLPNCFYDAEETSVRKQEATDEVETFIIVAKDVSILGSNVQVTQDHIDKLTALEEALGVQSDSIWKRIGYVAGHLVLLCFLMTLTIRFLMAYRSDFFVDSRRVLLIGILTLLFLIASKYALMVDSGEYMLPITFVALIMAGLYDIPLAIITVVFSITILAVSTSVPLNGILVALLAGGTSIFSIQQFRSRLQLYKSVAYVSLAYLLGILAIGLVEGGGDVRGIAISCLKGMGNGLICTWLVMPILPLLERYFDLTTNFTLLELTDLNRPILKRMKVEAPGTFQHSLVVSNLAEAAADAIGVNALLAKVCAYYHDIGKLQKPDYFSENQQGGRNRHDKLSPNMSALIIASHIKEGMDLAEKIKLPGVVRRGIPEHHGTTVMKYFYHKAVEQDAHGQVKDDDFRYSGPRPHSAETAILMLADSVEATARSFDSPSTAKIRAVVRESIDIRLSDGELEECGLSIRELAIIRESFITTLLSIYHPRIQYPSDKSKESPEKSGRRERGASATAAVESGDTSETVDDAVDLGPEGEITGEDDEQGDEAEAKPVDAAGLEGADAIIDPGKS